MRLNEQKLPLAAVLALVFLCGCGTNHSTTASQTPTTSPSQPGSGPTTGGGGSTGSVTVSPTTASVSAGSSVQFTAQVAGESSTAVHWFVNAVQNGDSTVGTISSSGLYTAPSCKPPASVTVKAQSVADGSIINTAAVTITASSTNVACTGRVPHSSHVV